MLKDQSRVKWLHSGDRNSHFFHNLLIRHRPQSGMHSLVINNSLVMDDSTIDAHVIDYFSTLFTAPTLAFRDYSFVREVIPTLVHDEDNCLLLRVPLDLEIKDIVFGMDQNSAPGPDGFSGVFFKNCW